MFSWTREFPDCGGVSYEPRRTGTDFFAFSVLSLSWASAWARLSGNRLFLDTDDRHKRQVATVVGANAPCLVVIIPDAILDGGVLMGYEDEGCIDDVPFPSLREALLGISLLTEADIAAADMHVVAVSEAIV
ncbi:MAG: hypothetical protein QOD84_1575 [Acidobacteriaceae bacterium]